jgi:hypothetical protein
VNLDATNESTASTLGSGLAHLRWSKEKDRAKATQPMRDAFWNKLLEQADGDVQRAESLRKAHYRAMAAKSAEARRAKKEAAARAALEAAEPHMAPALPTRDELAEWLREIFSADAEGTTWDVAAEELLLLLNGGAE